MCSTPKNSGTTCKVGRFVDDGADYASYSKMLRRASNRIDQRERDAQHKRQADARESSGNMPEAEKHQPISGNDSAAHQQPSSRVDGSNAVMSETGF